jgi:hypothetical protein
MARASKRRRSEIVDTINAALEIVDEVAQDGDGEFVRAVVAGFALKQISEGDYEDDREAEGEDRAPDEDEEEEDGEAEEPEEQPAEEAEEAAELEPEPPKRSRGRSGGSKSSGSTGSSGGSARKSSRVKK